MMRQSSWKRGPRLGLMVILILSVVLPGATQTSLEDQEKVQHQIEPAKIYKETYPLISESDLYCSPYIHDAEVPVLRIIGAEREKERNLLSDSDVVYLNMGRNEGLEVGQVFLIVNIGDSFGGYGLLTRRRGRAHVIHLEDSRAVARIEKSCREVRIGDYLLPFEEKESILGKDLGFEAYAEGRQGAVGEFIYLETDFNQVALGYWAIINAGEEAGIQVGQQMTIFRQIKEDLPPQGIGNLVVIDTRLKTATVKILSTSDSVRIGHKVVPK